jgi:hypothetical protein
LEGNFEVVHTPDLLRDTVNLGTDVEPLGGPDSFFQNGADLASMDRPLRAARTRKARWVSSGKLRTVRLGMISPSQECNQCHQ